MNIVWRCALMGFICTVLLIAGAVVCFISVPIDFVTRTIYSLRKHEDKRIKQWQS
jgi:hypothetical protein